MPHLAETAVDSFFDPGGCRSARPRDAEDLTPTADGLEATLAAGREAALEGTRDELENVRRLASRAADAEFEEYRQLREQQLGDLRDELRSVTDTLTAVAVETTGVDSQKQRVESLKERKRLRSDKQRLEQRRDEHL